MFSKRSIANQLIESINFESSFVFEYTLFVLINFFLFLIATNQLQTNVFLFRAVYLSVISRISALREKKKIFIVRFATPSANLFHLIFQVLFFFPSDFFIFFEYVFFNKFFLIYLDAFDSTHHLIDCSFNSKNSTRNKNEKKTKSKNLIEKKAQSDCFQ